MGVKLACESADAAESPERDGRRGERAREGALVGVMIALVACSGGKPKSAVDEAHKHDAAIAVARDAGAAVPQGPYRVADGPKGDVQITVEWHDVDAASRASTGRTACGTPHAAAVAPTVLWGIPEVMIVLAVDHGKPLVDPEARVVLDHCALVPRVVVAGGTLAIASASETPAKLTLTKQGDVRALDKIAAGAARPIQLPIAGHTVTAALEPGGVYELALDGDPETSWIIAETTPYASITDPTGRAILRDVPVGTYGVVAWLPARAGQHARIARGEVTITSGALGEVTLDLTKQ
ncbi:MAG: hypothetical protein JWO36_6159 [Myxococcales bacterium]|nr:hypothetical protein [Myxococcales bacterium]